MFRREDQRTNKGEVNLLTAMLINRKIALNLVMEAVADGDFAAIRQMKDTLDGKSAYAVNIGGQGESLAPTPLP